jgi:hypothetical protein
MNRFVNHAPAAQSACMVDLLDAALVAPSIHQEAASQL